jgi:hypothetical protein
MQAQRDAAKEEVAEVKTEFLSRISTAINIVCSITKPPVVSTLHK